MERKICVVGILVFCFLFVGMLAATPVGAEDQTKIMGTVIQKGNDEGGTYSCAVHTDSGVYDVSFVGKGRELMLMSNKKIEATGYVKEKAGSRTITITDYRVLE